MKRTLVTCAALLSALPSAAQVQVQTQQVGPGPGVAAPQQPSPAPCPGMGGIEIGLTRTFTFERMAKLEPAKSKVTRELKVVHKPAGRPWVITVTFDGEGPDAKVAAIYYYVDPPQGVGDALRERYGAGNPVAADASQTFWDIPSCSVRLKYRSRMGDKQHAVEELWAEPMTAKQAQQTKKKG